MIELLSLFGPPVIAVIAAVVLQRFRGKDGQLRGAAEQLREANSWAGAKYGSAEWHLYRLLKNQAMRKIVRARYSVVDMAAFWIYSLLFVTGVLLADEFLVEMLPVFVWLAFLWGLVILVSMISTFSWATRKRSEFLSKNIVGESKRE